MRKSFYNFGRKGEGTTLTWVIGTIVLFFVAIGFLGLVLLLSAQKFIGGGDEIFLEEEEISKLAAQRVLFDFLDSEIEFRGEKVRMRDFILEEDFDSGSAKWEFNEYAKEFNDYAIVYFLVVFEGVPGWIEVLEGDEGLVPPTEKYSSVYNLPPCDPIGFERVTFAEQAIGDKKIVLCISKI